MRWLILIAVSTASLFAQLAPPNPSGVSIGHVHIIVSDPAAQKHLWVDVLGAQVTATGSLELLRLPGIFIVLGKARTEPTGGSDGSTVNHFSFLVKSYADTKAKLSGAKVPLVSDNAGGKTFIADFPEKVRVEFTEDATLAVPVQFQRMLLASADPNKLRDWYVKTFGGKDGKRGQYAAALFPGGELDFMKVDSPAAPTKGRSLDHIGFELTGLEAFCKKLEAAGMPFDGTYRMVPTLGGLQLAYILDPEGTRIELTEGFMAHSHDSLTATAAPAPAPATAVQPPPPGYVARTPVKEGLAPGMKVTEFAKTGRNFEVVLSKGDEITSGLTDFATKYHLKTSHFTAVGALDSATFGWFDPEKRAYKIIPITSEVEILSFVGNIVVTNGKPQVHAHIVVALPDGSTRGGHFVEGRVSLTLQLFLEELEPVGGMEAAKTAQ